MCVSECPTEYWTYLTRFAEEQAEELVGSSDPADRTGFICLYDVDPTSNEYAVSKNFLQNSSASELKLVHVMTGLRRASTID